MSRRSYSGRHSHGLPIAYTELEYVRSPKSNAGFKVAFTVTGQIAGWKLKGRIVEVSGATASGFWLGVYEQTSPGHEWTLFKYIPSHSTYPNKSCFGFSYKVTNTSAAFERCFLNNDSVTDLQWASYINGNLTRFDGTTATVTREVHPDFTSPYIGIGSMWRTLNNEGFRTEERNSSDFGYVALYKGNTMMYELIPCKRKSDGKVGMYDILNDVFHYSETSTEFVAGPEL